MTLPFIFLKQHRPLIDMRFPVPEGRIHSRGVTCSADLRAVPYAYLYHTRMVHTIRVYAYDITIRVWYGLLYHTRMVHMRHHWCIYLVY